MIATRWSVGAAVQMRRLQFALKYGQSKNKAAPRFIRGAALIIAEVERGLSPTTLGGIFTFDRLVRSVIEVAAFLFAVEVAVGVVSGALAAEGHFAFVLPGEG